MDDNKRRIDENCSAEESLVEDLKLLIECIKYQEDDVAYQEQALKTIASLCCTNEDASNYLVHSHGLRYVLGIILKTSVPVSLKVACLHVLCGACENNAIAQRLLCEEEMFLVLKRFLTAKSTVRLQILSSYLLICLVTNNDKGQVLTRKTKCLDTLRYLFKDVCSPSCSPQNRNRLAEYLAADSEGSQEYQNLWQAATNALAVCINNPQNNRAQVSFRLVGGLRVLSHILQDEMSAGNQIPSSVLSAVVLTLEAAVCGNDMCRKAAAELEIIPSLLQCAQLCFGSPKFKVECLMAISACIEECASNCQTFSSHEGIAVLVKLLAENQNCEELQKTATCVLHTYMEQTRLLDAKSVNEMSSKPFLTKRTAEAVKTDKVSAPDALRERGGNDNDENNVMRRASDAWSNGSSNEPCSSSSLRGDQCGSVVNHLKDLSDEVRGLKQLIEAKEEKLDWSSVDVPRTNLGKKDGNPQGPYMSSHTTSIDPIIVSGQESMDVAESNNVNRHSNQNTQWAVTASANAVGKNCVAEPSANMRNVHDALLSQNKLKSLKSTHNDFKYQNTEDEYKVSSTKARVCSSLHDVDGSNPFDEIFHGNYVRDKGPEPTSYRDSISIRSDETGVVNVRYGETPDKCSTVVHDQRPKKRLFSALQKQVSPPLPLRDEELNYRSDMRKEDVTLPSSDEEVPSGSRDEAESSDEPVPVTARNVLHERGPPVKSRKHPLKSESSDEEVPEGTRDDVRETPVLVQRHKLTFTRSEPSDEQFRGTARDERQPAVKCHKKHHIRSKSSNELVLSGHRDDIHKTPTSARRQTLTLIRPELPVTARCELLVKSRKQYHIKSESSDEVQSSSGRVKQHECLPPVKFYRVNQTGPLLSRQKRKISVKCIGCSIDFNKTNSTNFLSTLRRNLNTCSFHRDYAMHLMTALRRYKKFLETRQRSPSFDFTSSPKLNTSCSYSLSKISKKVKPKQQRSTSKVAFTEEDIETLRSGVKRYGRRWTVIQRKCQFSVKRSAKTLKQKFESISEKVKRTKRCPFSIQEEENLKEGVLKYGFEWRKIIDRYIFKEGRTPQDLKDKWRNLTNYVYN